MRLAKLVVIILFINSLLQFFIPVWWLLALVCFVACWVWATSNRHAFISSSIGIALSYLAMMLVLEYPSGFVVSDKMATLFSLPNGALFYIISILIGGFMGGLSGMCGFLGNKFLRSTKSAA
jgi:hypothetical protein